MLNNMGDNRHVCHTPVVVLNHELNVPSHITALLASWYRDSMQFISDLLMLYFLITAQSPWCQRPWWSLWKCDVILCCAQCISRWGFVDWGFVQWCFSLLWNQLVLLPLCFLLVPSVLIVWFVVVLCLDDLLKILCGSYCNKLSKLRNWRMNFKY